MSTSIGKGGVAAHVLLWIARLTAIAALVPLMLIFFGEPGSGPAGVREYAYLALFPIGFSAGYLLGWRWPLAGGLISLACMAASLMVIGRTYSLGAYVIWGILCVPGILYVAAGLMLRGGAESADVIAAR